MLLFFLYPELRRSVVLADNKEELTRELAIAKITSSNESVKKYTGLPFKKILDGVFGKCIVIKKLLKIFVNL